FAWSTAGAAVLMSDAAGPAAPSLDTFCSTVEAAVGALTGRAAVGAVSADVLTLVEGVRKTMFRKKLTLIAGLLMFAVAATSAWFASLSDVSAQPQPPQGTPRSKAAKASP